jgi:hypothetical protein
MFFRLVTLAATLLSTLANNGPSSLYTLLNGQTFNPPGYTIVMYQSCMQNQNAGNPCGSFSGYQSSNGQYTYQLYGPEAAVSPTCSRTFKLTLACGPTMQMSGVNENPTCVYSATLSLPQVCGVDFTVGNEVASISPTALPPTVSSTTTPSLSSTNTLTATSTITASTTSTLTATSTTTLTATPTSTSTNTLTGTPLFQITAWPTTSSTTTLTATGTPLFMITAWPTTSPVNVSATSTPLYYYTAYPSVGSNATGGLLGFASSMMSSGSSTATIVGSVALGIVGLGAIIGVVAYLRKGGTIGGLINKVKENKENIAKFANALPISEADKAKLNKAIDDPSSILPSEAQAALAQAKAQAEAYKAQAIQANQALIQALPPSIGAALAEKQNELLSQVQVQMQEKQNAIMSFAPVHTSLATLPTIVPDVTSVVKPEEAVEVRPEEVKPEEVKPEEVKPEEVKPEEVKPEEVKPIEQANIVINSNDVAAVRNFLERRGKR